MTHNHSHTQDWKILTLEVNTPGSIIRIDEKLEKHIASIQAVNVSCIPSQIINHDVIECGELSLSMNHRSQHVLHHIVSCDALLFDGYNQLINIQTDVKKYSRLTGYYRDYQQLKNPEGAFIPYQVKITLQFTKTQSHE